MQCILSAFEPSPEFKTLCQQLDLTVKDILIAIHEAQRSPDPKQTWLNIFKVMRMDYIDGLSSHDKHELDNTADMLYNEVSIWLNKLMRYAIPKNPTLELIDLQLLPDRAVLEYATDCPVPVPISNSSSIYKL